MNSKTLKLVIGDKNLSSWSLRAWLPMMQSGLPFEEVLVVLDRPETPGKLKTNSPSEKVPCLIHGDFSVWDSMAICEYLHELAADKKLWPSDIQQRARARSLVAEMHSGFPSLRAKLSMDIRLRTQVRHLTPQTIDEINRVLSLWTSTLQTSEGPFLFGEFGIADAFYAPVVFRFQSYGIEIKSRRIHEYMKSIFTHPHVKAWADAATKEEPFIVQF